MDHWFTALGGPLSQIIGPEPKQSQWLHRPGDQASGLATCYAPCMRVAIGRGAGVSSPRGNRRSGECRIVGRVDVLTDERLHLRRPVDPGQPGVKHQLGHPSGRANLHLQDV